MYLVFYKSLIKILLFGFRPKTIIMLFLSLMLVAVQASLDAVLESEFSKREDDFEKSKRTDLISRLKKLD